MKTDCIYYDNIEGVSFCQKNNKHIGCENCNKYENMYILRIKQIKKEIKDKKQIIKNLKECLKNPDDSKKDLKTI